MGSVATMQSIGWALTDLHFICLWTSGTGLVKSVIAACSPAMVGQRLRRLVVIHVVAGWLWWASRGWFSVDTQAHLSARKFFLSVCDPNQSIVVVFLRGLVFSVIFFLPHNGLFLNSIVPFFQLKANQFPCFDLCLCAPQLHHIHHSPGSLPKFYAATLRVDISGRGWRGGKKGGKGMCVRKKKRKKKQENHPVNSARSSEVSLHCWWVYGLPGVKRGFAYGSAVVLIRSSCLMWLENKRLSSQN